MTSQPVGLPAFSEPSLTSAFRKDQHWCHTLALIFIPPICFFGIPKRAHTSTLGGSLLSPLQHLGIITRCFFHLYPKHWNNNLKWRSDEGRCVLSLFVVFLESLFSFIRIGCIMSDSIHRLGKNVWEITLLPFAFELGGGTESDVPLTSFQMSKCHFTPLGLFKFNWNAAFEHFLAFSVVKCVS